MSDSEWTDSTCPCCGKPPHQVVGQAAECANGNCSVLQYLVDRSTTDNGGKQE